MADMDRLMSLCRTRALQRIIDLEAVLLDVLSAEDRWRRATEASDLRAADAVLRAAAAKAREVLGDG